MVFFNHPFNSVSPWERFRSKCKLTLWDIGDIFRMLFGCDTGTCFLGWKDGKPKADTELEGHVKTRKQGEFREREDLG
jgi:hypothetical protein